MYGEHTPATCPRKSDEGCPDKLRKRLREGDFVGPASAFRKVNGNASESDGDVLWTASALKDQPGNKDSVVNADENIKYGLPPPASIRPAYCDLPNDFMPADELGLLVSKRPDAPLFLRCYACAVLARDAMWCACCDILACHGCLTPIGNPEEDAPWSCPKCNVTLLCGEAAGVEVETFGHTASAHAVTPIRSVIAAWTRATMEAIDPYSRAISGPR